MQNQVSSFETAAVNQVQAQKNEIPFTKITVWEKYLALLFSIIVLLGS